MTRRNAGGAVVAVSVVLAGTLSACTSGSGGSAAPSSTFVRPTPSRPTALATTHLSKECARLASAANAINDAQGTLYTSGGDPASVHALQTRLRSLRAGTPANVSAALTELATGFGTAQQLLAHHGKNNNAKLGQLQQKLSADGQLVSQYVVEKCPAK
jgi:hypothetical protein